MRKSMIKGLPEALKEVEKKGQTSGEGEFGGFGMRTEYRYKIRTLGKSLGTREGKHEKKTEEKRSMKMGIWERLKSRIMK